MATKRAGGRPPKDWTSSRCRTLARLYSLTNLSVDQIIATLSAEDFKVSKRAVQYKLETLFPEDYSKDYDSYRAKNCRTMQRRVQPFLGNRVKPIYSTPNEYHPVQNGSRPQPSPSKGNNLLDPAFRNYGDVNTPIGAQTITSSSILGSEVTNSSLVMLDGSILYRTPSSLGSPAPPTTSNLQSIDISALGPNKAVQSGLVYDNFNAISTVAPIDLVTRIDTLTISPVPPAVRERQEIVASETVAESGLLTPPDFLRRHIKYLAACSTVGSLVSTVQWSKFVSERSWSLPKRTKPDSFDKRSDFPEGHILPDLYQYIRVSCCHQRQACEICGLKTAHINLATGWPVSLTFKIDASQEDYFGNTLLHSAASSSESDPIAIWYLIESGVDIYRRNSLGQTFLHIVKFSNRWGAVEFLQRDFTYLDLLHFLAKRHFPFAARDAYGKTILQVICGYSQEQYGSVAFPASIETFSMMLEAIGTHLDHMAYGSENDGLTKIMNHRNEAFSSPLPDFRLVLRRHCMSLFRGVSFCDELSSVTHIEEIESWTTSVRNRGLANCLDKKGLMPLTALLRSSLPRGNELRIREAVKTLIIPELCLEMRAEDGNTPLTLACLQGQRPTVGLLLEMGATPNTAHMLHGSPLLQLRRGIMRTRKDDNKEATRSYARLLSCSSLLADAGAKLNPTEAEQWYTQRAILKMRPVS